MNIKTLCQKIWPKIVSIYPIVSWVNFIAMVCLGVGIVSLSALNLNPTQLATLDSMFKSVLWVEGFLLGVHTIFVSHEKYPNTQSIPTDQSPLENVTVAGALEHCNGDELINTRRLKL